MHKVRCYIQFLLLCGDRRSSLNRQLDHLRRQSYSGDLHTLMEEEENLENEEKFKRERKDIDCDLNKPLSELELYYLNL